MIFVQIINKTKNLQQLYNNSSQEEKKDILEQQYENWLNTNSNSEIERQHLSQMIRMYSDEKLTPLETLIAERKGKNKLEWEKYCEIQNEKVKQAQLKENEKKERLLKIYTKEEVENIMSKKLWLGMTEEMLYEVRNRPLDISENVSKGVVKKKHYYDKSTNRLGNDAFDFEVTLENGKVTGWKDRRNRGTRDI